MGDLTLDPVFFSHVIEGEFIHAGPKAWAHTSGYLFEYEPCAPGDGICGVRNADPVADGVAVRCVLMPGHDGPHLGHEEAVQDRFPFRVVRMTRSGIHVGPGDQPEDGGVG